jgi:hypothetical protein
LPPPADVEKEAGKANADEAADAEEGVRANTLARFW